MEYHEVYFISSVSYCTYYYLLMLYQREGHLQVTVDLDFSYQHLAALGISFPLWNY